jgi:hypothetical protein
LLRPVIERAILPTVSYIAGPGEIAYFAQVSAVAAALDLDAPMVVPRWSTTIVEPHVSRILSRLGIEESELAEPHRAEGGWLARRSRLDSRPRYRSCETSWPAEPAPSAMHCATASCRCRLESSMERETRCSTGWNVSNGESLRR